MDAMLCRIDLHTGNLDAADIWYREKAPRDPMHINVMSRYQYLTQAMVELAAGKNEAVLITLAPLKPYCSTCARHIDSIHLNVLSAIALYRSKSDTWQELLREALYTAAYYHFIRTISMYGAAVLPLLEQLQWENDGK